MDYFSIATVDYFSIGIYIALAIATAIAMALGLTSCNVTRTITTESKSVTRDDTAIIIQTKTVESYNAKKN